MSREQDRDPFRRLRAELQDSQRHRYGLNTKTVSSSSYQDTVQRTTRGNLDISSHRSIRDAANMPIFLDDTHKSDILSRDFNSSYDSNIQPSNIRSRTTPASAALEALQTYGPVAPSPSHSSVQRDWNVAFPKNINKPPENLEAFLSSMLKSKDSNIQTYSAESSTMSTSDISCPPFNDLNLNNVDEEDEYLYGDSNSLPEMPQLLKNDSDQSNAKTERPMWSDEEDLFGESSVTSRNKSNLDQMKGSTVWGSQSKNIQLKLSQKLGGNTNDSSRNMPPETYSVEQQHSSVSSADCQNVRNFLNKFPEKDVKNIMSEKDSQVTSTSSVKSKYHAAAQVLKKKITEKSKNFASETTDFPSNYPADMKNNSMSFKKDIQENKLMTKSSIPIKDSKELVRKSGENVKRLPKAFLQKDLNIIADYIKPQRKRMHSREEGEYIKHPRHENYRNISPNKDQPPHQSSRHRSPVDEHRHHSPYHSRNRSPESDLRYKIPHHFKSKSPHRDYDRHSYEYNARHNESRWHHSRSPSRKSSEQSTRHYNYRARSPGSFRSRERSRSPGSFRSREKSRSPGSFRSRERSRSPGSFRSRERSRSPGSFRSRERSRSPGYHRSGDRGHEHRKDSYKSKELLSKGEPRDSESRNRKKTQNYSSDDSLGTLSLESESASSDSSDDIQDKKEKSAPKPKTKDNRTDNTKSLKTDTPKIEKKALEDMFVKKADKSVLPDNMSSQNLAELCNFQDKTSEDPALNEILKYFDNKGSDKLSNIVKMFENSHLVRELVEGVQEHVNSLTQPTPPPDAAHNTPEQVNSVTHSISSLDAAHNIPNLLTPSSFVPNVSFPSSEPYPIMPSVHIPFHPPPINSLPPLTFPPPPLVPPPVVPPPVMPLRVLPPPTVPPPVPASVPTSVYGSFPVSLPSVDVSRIPDTKQVKKRPVTLRPINITVDMPSPSKSSKEHSQPSLVTAAESKDKKIEKEKTSELFSEQNNILIETYKKLKTEKHYAHVKVNSCVSDMLEMRKMMDDTWGKKGNPSDIIFYSKCKNMISASSSTMNECLKEARRLDDELNRFRGLVPKHILDELGNMKIEEPPKYGNVHYSCYDTSNHTCDLCCKPFPNLLGILEHLHSDEHKEQMTSNDKDWTKKFKKPDKSKDDKNTVLQPVKGVEFMKPFTGYFCSLCSETLLDKASAEQHLKSNDHYCQYKDYNFKNPIYEKKFFFKKFIQRSILSKAKEKIKMQEREQKIKTAEEANEKVKDALRDQKRREKIVEDLEDDDADPLSSKSHSSSGIKLNLSNDKEKDKQNVKAAKAPQRVVYIGKAPNFKARKPWYKKDIYQKNDESSSQSTEATVPIITLSKEKNSGNGRESSPSINRDSLGDNIPEAIAVIKKGKITSKKVIESTCLTEEDSKKLGTSSNNASLSCKENDSTVSNDPTICSTEGESKNLNTNCADPKNVLLGTDSSVQEIPLNEIQLPDTYGQNSSNIPTNSLVTILSTENAQPVSGDSGSIMNADASSKQSTSVQNTKDTHNQSGSPANENRDGTIAISKDSTVNQALKNILLGTDSSVQDIPLNEIQLPDTHGQNSSNIPTNSLLSGESNIPVPMEIEDTNDEAVFNPPPKLTTEEDRDFYILGINREDFLPLVVPVPPPSSLLNSGSPSHSPAASSPKHNNSSENKVSPNANESKVIPASPSTDLNKLHSLQKKTIECSNNNSKYSINSSNLIILTDNTLQSESLLQSDTVTTPVEFKNLITISVTGESSDVNTNDVTAAVSTESQDASIESSVDTDASKEDSIMQINETSLETTKAIPLETDSITEKSSQMSDASGSNENLNEVVSSDDKNLKKEPETNLNLIEAVAQDGVTEKPSHITDAEKSNENLNEVVSSDDKNLKKEPETNLNLIEAVAQDGVTEKPSHISDAEKSNENLNEVVSSDDKNFKKEPETNLNLIEAVAQDGVTERSSHISDAAKSNENLNEVTSSDTENLKKEPETNVNLIETVAQDGVTERSSHISDAAKSNENLNEVTSSDNENLKKEPETNINLIEAVAQDGVTERSSHISDAAKSNENLNEVTSSDNENLKKEPDINLSIIEDVAQGEIVNQITSAIDCVIPESQQADSDSISISRCESSDSSNMADRVEIRAESLVVKDSDNGTFSSSIKPPDINQNSDLEPVQKSAVQNQISCENNISDVEVCASTNQTIPVKSELDDIESTQDLVFGQSLNQDSSNEVSGMEVCETVHMQDQESNIKPCENLIIKQESPKENVSESCISPDILISDQQSNSDIKPDQSSEAKQLLNKVSVNENTDMEVTISENKAVTSQQCIQSDIEVVSEQSTCQDSHRKSVSDMEVCVSVSEMSPEMDQPSNSKPNLNLVGSNGSISPMQSSEKDVNTETIDVVVKEKISEQSAIDIEMTSEKKDDDELITTPSSTDLPTEIISDTKISSSIPESADINLTTSVNNSSDSILDSHSSIVPEQCLSKNICSPEVVRMEIESEQQAVFTEEKSELITVNNSSDSILDSHSSIIPEQCLSKNVCSPEVVRMEIESEQQAVFTEEKSELITVNNSSDSILDSHSSIIPEQCLSKTVCSSEVVRMEIESEQQAVFTEEKSECNVKSDQDLSLLHSLNQNLVTESTSDVTEEKLLQECHTLKKSNETEFVADNICDSISADSSHLISENLSENKSFEMDDKNLQPEPVLISVKSECEITCSEGVISQLSSNQCDSTSEKTVSSAVDTSSPDESASEDLNPVDISVTRGSVSGQETTQQKLDVILESSPTVNKENEEIVPDCNASIMSQMDENQQAESETNLKSPGLEENIAADPESNTQISSSSPSGEVLKTPNLTKSDTDTDEYENEE